ncbi:hypothetical protein BGZ76_009030 [Entomortierella beljakovae]|nr:hypothetical protein BGZ76_009030 [Entomortierella beljakovae]
MEYSGLNYSNGSYSSRPSIHSNQRRTLTSSTGPSYLPSLQRCVYTLEKSTRLLKSSVSMLDEATNGYQRLKTITTNIKQFELVSEHDINEAQGHVSKEIIPQLFAVTDKAINMIYALESKEFQLRDRVAAEEEKEKQHLILQKANKSGISNINRLQSLTRRKEELSKTLSELDEVIGQKRNEFAEIVEKAQAGESQSKSQPGPFKKSRRNLTIESRDLSLKEEERKQNITRNEKELEAIQLKILDKRRSVNEIRSKIESQHSRPLGQTVPWSMYSDHYKFLETALQNEFKVDSRDKSAYEDAFARLSTAYLRELDSRQAKNDFPPEEERRHNLGRVISILKQAEVLELVLETRETKNGDDEVGQSVDQIILRIKFSDDGQTQQ